MGRSITDAKKSEKQIFNKSENLKINPTTCGDEQQQSEIKWSCSSTEGSELGSRILIESPPIGDRCSSSSSSIFEKRFFSPSKTAMIFGDRKGAMENPERKPKAQEKKEAMERATEERESNGGDQLRTLQSNQNITLFPFSYFQLSYNSQLWVFMQMLGIAYLVHLVVYICKYSKITFNYLNSK